MTIDWTKPIETVPCERNPNPVPCEFAGMYGGTASYFIRGDWFAPHGGNQIDPDDEGCPWYHTGYDNLPKLRNVETTGTTADETPTLRDQFAMAALTGIMTDASFRYHIEDAADAAYRAADAMMQARK